MTEFDFDELDRAVNNLMSDVDTSKRDEAFDDPQEKTIELPGAPEQVSTRSTASVVATPPLAVMRRGRFMDVVRPSSDMSSPVAPKREPIVIQPSTSGQSVSTVDLPAIESPVPETNAEAAQDEGASSDADTYADLNESPEFDTSERDDQSGETGASEDLQATDSDESPEPGQHTPESPMESPFLADAKVEKRPLGAPSDQSGEVIDVMPSQFEETQPEPAPSPEELPASDPTPQETDSEVVTIEPNSTPEANSGQDTPSSSVAEQLVSVESSTPTDIVPQYTESVSRDNEPSGAIYDTSAYHQPLEHPAKKRTGWMVVLWVLLLLIIGAAAGAAYFYFTTRY